MKRITEDGEIVDINCEDCVTGIIPFFKTPHNHDTNKESDKYALTCLDESKTDQSFKDETDVNFLMDNIYKRGAIPNVVLPEHFGDAFMIPTLLQARTAIAENNATFYKLPASIREEFLNDPARWEQQVAKDVREANLENLERMGIDMKQVRERIQQLETAQADEEDRQAEAQLSELQERLARRAAAPQAGIPAPGAPTGEGGTQTPRTRKD